MAISAHRRAGIHAIDPVESSLLSCPWKRQITGNGVSAQIDTCGSRLVPRYWGQQCSWW
ncbi:hypothetical protein M378DRAFT_1011711 [Amanita muscaria Koide BX008]|uniref:Uncharacterized protein n=1 Tax=Amanita muscaria (strain Koide BX008) TaxID=946122 RepID=A0A0C2WDB5_AMAMK|nr:hypothetical protein M378DRAFT_1011711 [Amanita muscaria Koide BX008]